MKLRVGGLVLLLLCPVVWAGEDAAAPIVVTAQTAHKGQLAAVSGAEVVQGLQSLTPQQLDRVLADYDKFDDNTKRQFKDVLANPNPFTLALLTSAANRIAPESRLQLADSIARVKASK